MGQRIVIRDSEQVNEALYQLSCFRLTHNVRENSVNQSILSALSWLAQLTCYRFRDVLRTSLQRYGVHD